MYDVADSLATLPPDSVVVRVVELSGFGSRHAGEAAAYGPDGTVVAGRLLAGLTDPAVAAHIQAGATAGILTVAVSDPDAAASGMACGGSAQLLVQPIAAIDPMGWAALGERRSVVVASDLSTGRARAITDDGETAGSIHQDDRVEEVAHRLLRAGRSTVEVHEGTMFESFLPPTTVRIVGHAGVGDALAAQAELLGWRHVTVDGGEEAAAAGGEQASHDALVVLSHDPAVDTPALAAALRHGRGYVGALGSRDTQAARRDRLRADGFDDDALATIHGPVGLDLGSRTPAETAVAIVAEIIAHRSGRSPSSLNATAGPING